MIKKIPIALLGPIVAVLVMAIAILSVQNATPVQLTFLGLQSIQMPVGVVLAASVAIGAIIGAIAPLILEK